jgi:lysophospholipase L1-like esterase
MTEFFGTEQVGCVKRTKFSWRCVSRTLRALLAVLWLTANAQADVSLRIMPLGDSITAGYTDSAGTVPFSFGYRGPLYTRLTNAGYSVQYLGTSPQPWVGPWSPPTQISGIDLRTVGQDKHNGYAGWIASDLTNGYGDYPGIVSALNQNNPDVVLLMIGINQIPQTGTANPVAAENSLNTLVQTIVNTKPNVKLLVAQIAPYVTSGTGSIDPVVQYNNYIRNTLVPSYASQGKHVTTVNQYANFLTTGGAIDASMFAGVNHPDVAGYDRMSQTWLTGIQAVTAPEPSSLSLLAGFGLMLAVRACWRVRRHTTLHDPGRARLLPSQGRVFSLCLAFALTAAVFGGCGDRGPERTVVSGSVTYNGKPVADGEIRFMPVTTTVAPMSGARIVDGKYTVSGHGGVPVGTHTVQIKGFHAIAPITGPAGVAPLMRNPPCQQYVPQRYNSDSQLKITIEPGSREIAKDFTLTD